MGYVMRQTGAMGPFSVEARGESVVIVVDEGVKAFHTAAMSDSGFVTVDPSYIEIGHEHIDALIEAFQAAKHARDHGEKDWEERHAEAIQARERREQGEYVDALLARAGWGPRS